MQSSKIAHTLQGIADSNRDGPEPLLVHDRECLIEPEWPRELNIASKRGMETYIKSDGDEWRYGAI